jgi:hypothetical protein
MSKKAKRWQIRTISDMHAIPADEIQDFLTDLGAWLLIMRAAEALPLNPISPRDMFEWIQDGKHNVHVKLHILPQEAAK